MPAVPPPCAPGHAPGLGRSDAAVRIPVGFDPTRKRLRRRRIHFVINSFFRWRSKDGTPGDTKTDTNSPIWREPHDLGVTSVSAAFSDAGPQKRWRLRLSLGPVICGNEMGPRKNASWVAGGPQYHPFAP